MAAGRCFQAPLPESGYAVARFRSRTAGKSFALTKSDTKRIWLNAEQSAQFTPPRLTSVPPLRHFGTETR
jgi:hypothetical protein